MHDPQEFSQRIQEEFDAPDDLPDMMALLLLMVIVTHAPNLDQKFSHITEARKLISAHPELRDLLKSAWKAKIFESILDFRECSCHRLGESSRVISF